MNEEQTSKFLRQFEDFTGNIESVADEIRGLAETNNNLHNLSERDYIREVAPMIAQGIVSGNSDAAAHFVSKHAIEIATLLAKGTA